MWCCSVVHCVAVSGCGQYGDIQRVGPRLCVVAVFCSVLQFVAVCRSVLQCVAVCVAVCCSVVCCSVLHSGVLQFFLGFAQSRGW